MFGLFYMAANAIAYMISGTKMMIEDEQSRNEARKREMQGNNRAGLYTDHRGTTRDIRTNQIRHTWKDWDTKDVWLEDMHGNRIRNLSEERRNEEFLENKRLYPNNRAFKYTEWNRKTSLVKFDDILTMVKGDIYKDTENGDLYVKREIVWYMEDRSPYVHGMLTTKYLREKGEPYCYIGQFYMKIKDGTLVGLADGKQKTRVNCILPDENELQEFIEDFNNRQKGDGWLESWDGNRYDKEENRIQYEEKRFRDFYLLDDRYHAY